MFIKTVSTTSGINPIKFDETGGVFYWILNTGLSTVYASTKSTFTAGDDGVVSLGPKESRRLETNNDTIYILGAGQVEIHNQRDGICSFKQAPTSSGSGGGGTIDAYSKTESDAKYAAKSDVPDAYTKTESDDKYAQKTDVVPYKMGMDFGTCATPAETVVKSVTTMHKVAPALGAVFAVKFNNAVPAQARLNINGLTGYIQYQGGSIPNGVINAGDIATFIYYSSSGFNTFEILSVENGGNADTVDGYHVDNLIHASGSIPPEYITEFLRINDDTNSIERWSANNLKVAFANNAAKAENAENADTVDGLHASDFVRAFNSSEMNNNRILIPNDVHVGNWLAANAEVGMQYYKNTDCSGQTGLPDGGNDWAWFLYDGLIHIAKTSYNRFFIMDYINSYNGWKEISTTPIKSTTFSGTTDANGNLMLWAASENKIPICAILNGYRSSIFHYAPDGNYYLGVTDISRQIYSPNVPISGTVYYI